MTVSLLSEEFKPLCDLYVRIKIAIEEILGNVVMGLSEPEDTAVID
jgi:hypothetical protein